MNVGRLFQNLIYLILYDNLNNTMFSIHYWRTSDLAEVDFVIQGGHHPIPVEVKFSHLKSPKVTRSFRSFVQSYQPDVAYVVNLSYSDDIKIDKTVVRFVPYYALYGEKF